jgi:hypothetical protein
MSEIRTQKLIFVYNANAGIRNTVLDSAHKILSPKTYECSLCDITYGAFMEKRIWKKFREKFDYKMEFLHKDEFKKQYASKFGYKFKFPVVLGTSNGNFEIFISKSELNGLANADELIRLIQSRI